MTLREGWGFLCGGGEGRICLQKTGFIGCGRARSGGKPLNGTACNGFRQGVAVCDFQVRGIQRDRLSLLGICAERGADSLRPIPDSISRLELYKYRLEIYKCRLYLYISSLYFKSALLVDELLPMEGAFRLCFHVPGSAPAGEGKERLVREVTVRRCRTLPGLVLFCPCDNVIEAKW